MSENGNKPINLNDPEDCWDKFWKDIVAPDGSLNLEQVKKELSDFSKVMTAVPAVYDHVTGGHITNLMTHPDEVCRAADDHYEIIHSGD